MINNKGLAPIFIIILIILISASGYLGYYFYTTGQLPFSNLQSNLTTKYNSIGFLKFKHLEHDQNEVNEFLKNPEKSKCYKLEYFKEVTIEEYPRENNIYLYSFPEGEEPLCKGAPDPYSRIQLIYIDLNFSMTDYNNPDFATWVRDENLSTQRLDVFKNTNTYQTIGRDYFLIIDKNSTKDDGIIISIIPAIPEESIEYQYVLRLINAFEIKEFTEFTGLSNCKPNECKELEVSKGYQNFGNFQDTAYTIIDQKITLTDTKTGNEYYKFVNTTRDFKTDSIIGKISKINNFLIFDYTIKQIDLDGNGEVTNKIGILDLTNGQIKDIIVAPKGISFQDFLVAEDTVFFITGATYAGGPIQEEIKKYIFSYDFKTNQTTRLFDKSLGELGITENEESERFSLLKFENNNLLMKIGQLQQPAFNYVELDITTGAINPITQNFEVFFPDDKTKESGLGVAKFEKLIIKEGNIIQQ